MIEIFSFSLSLTHTESPLQNTRTHAVSQTISFHNIKGGMRNKFDTSSSPKSALRTKRNLISDKPPDRISALAFCYWFTESLFSAYLLPDSFLSYLLPLLLFLSDSLATSFFLFSVFTPCIYFQSICIYIYCSFRLCCCALLYSW